MKSKLSLLLSLMALSFLFACQKEAIKIDGNGQPRLPFLNIKASTPPFPLSIYGGQFYKDISYGPEERHKMDLFTPATDDPNAYVLYIHGGGFLGGSKDLAYLYQDNQELFNGLLEENISIIAINYSLINANLQNRGITKSLEDCLTALQFTKFYSSYLNLQKEEVVLIGESAGAGASLWVGLQDSLVSRNRRGLLQTQSNKVKGILALETQANYDIFTWSASVFKEFELQGFDQKSIENMLGPQYLSAVYGLPNLLFKMSISTSMFSYLNFLHFLSPDDPELYICNKDEEAGIPQNSSQLVHHPFHAKAIVKKAQKEGLHVQASIPALQVEPEETELEFVLRILGDN